MVIVRESDTVGALHVDGRITAVGLQDLDIADRVALAVDGEAQTRDLREVAVEHRYEGSATGEHQL